MRKFFHGRKPHPEPPAHIPLVGKILMGIGLLCVIYLLTVYVLIPFLAMLTPKS